MELMRRSRFDGGSRGAEKEDMTAEMDWEMRPGGMLVQKRLVDNLTPPPPLIRLRISYRESKFEIFVDSRATFRELKKELEAKTGLRLVEQRVIFRGKERENGEFLDRCGVKDRSKLVVAEDPSSLERRRIEMLRDAKIQSTSRAVAALSLEIDKLANQVSVMEKSISGKQKVPDLQITTLIELLMRQAVKLDGIPAVGDTSFQKHLQASLAFATYQETVWDDDDAGKSYISTAKRIQKSVETLDVLKTSNEKLKHVIVTTNWETFDPPSTTQLNFLD